jgi:uncharacterized membrane protein HdeD (DUF308 family)
VGRRDGLRPVRRRLAAGGLVVVGVAGVVVLPVLGGPGTPLYAGFFLLVAGAGTTLYADDPRWTATGFGLVAAVALLLGAGRLAVRGSIDPLVVLLVVLACVAGWRSYQYLRVARARDPPTE